MPADGAYARGELGVVKPTFARRYLVQRTRSAGCRRCGRRCRDPARTAFKNGARSGASTTAAAGLKPIASARIAADSPR